MEVLGGTRDDAAGECFDKVARVLGIGYPGGGPMDRLAHGGDDGGTSCPRAHVAGHDLDMSFSGLKTASLNLIHNAQQKGEELNLPDFAASFGRAVSESLVPRVMAAARMRGYGRVAVAGGRGGQQPHPGGPHRRLPGERRPPVPARAEILRRQRRYDRMSGIL